MLEIKCPYNAYMSFKSVAEACNLPGFCCTLDHDGCIHLVRTMFITIRCRVRWRFAKWAGVTSSFGWENHSYWESTLWYEVLDRSYSSRAFAVYARRQFHIWRAVISHYHLHYKQMMQHTTAAPMRGSWNSLKQCFHLTNASHALLAKREAMPVLLFVLFL